MSRRVSEFVGVALFAAALIWIIALASYDPNDPVWFFSTGAPGATVNNFVGRVGAFLGELSFQLFGYASYIIPAVLVIIGWNYFWCRSLDAAGTKTLGASLLVGCFSALLSLVFGSLEVSGKSFRAGGYAGDWVARLLSDYLNRTGSVIVILTLILLAIIVSTQFSFGRLFAALSETTAAGAVRALESFREWREERRREQQRREVIAKHTKKGAPAPEVRAVAAGADNAAGQTRRHRAQRLRGSGLGRAEAAGRRPAIVCAGQTAQGQPAGAPAAAVGSGTDGQGARRAAQGRVRPAAGGAARCAEDRREDRRARADGRRAAARRKVPRVLGRRRRHPDPSRSGRHHLRVQARRRREDREDHQPRRRPVPRHAGRIGPDRPHPRQVDRRHPDSQRRPASRSRSASCSSPSSTGDRRRSSRSPWARRFTANRTSPISRPCRIS